MNDHTSGPWKVDTNPHGHAIRVRRVSNKAMEPGRKIATMYGFGKIDRDNARLIAEAPQMLKACEAIVECIRDCSSCEGSGKEIGNEADACFSCGGVGQVLGGDDIFAAFEAREILGRLK